MAGYELIDAYLAELGRRMVWRPDVDDVLAEAEDHLITATERLIGAGADAATAQREVLGRFGDPTTVATAYAATSTGGLAMPTKFTKWAGAVAIAASVLWIASATMWLIDEAIDPTDGAELLVTNLALATLVSAAGLTAVVVIGLHRRHGGLGPLGAIGVGLVAVGVVATLAFWFVMGWGVLLAAGMLLVAVAVRARGLAPTAATMAFGGAWIVGVVTWSILRVLEVGTRDEWGDYPIVSPIAITVGVVVLVPGLIGLGRWLAGETPTDLDSPDPLATA